VFRSLSNRQFARTQQPTDGHGGVDDPVRSVGGSAPSVSILSPSWPRADTRGGSAIVRSCVRIMGSGEIAAGDATRPRFHARTNEQSPAKPKRTGPRQPPPEGKKLRTSVSAKERSAMQTFAEPLVAGSRFPTCERRRVLSAMQVCSCGTS